MKEGDYIKFRYNGGIKEGMIVRVVHDSLHPSSYAVAIGGKTVRVMESQVVK